MDINRLKEFIVLADCLNYSKAANTLFLTQPVLSRHIHDLEETFGTQLFIRDTHKVQLTPIGKVAAQEISKIIDVYNESMRNIHLAIDHVNDNLHVGFLGLAVKPFITQFLALFHTQHPEINISYVDSNLDELIDDVSNGSLDLAFITHIEPERFKGLTCRKIMNDPLCAVLPLDDPLTEQETVSLEDLAGKPMIVFDKNTNPHTALFHERLFHRLHFKLNEVRKVSNVETGLFYVTLGVGIFIIPEHLKAMANENVAVRQISDEEAYLTLHLIWRTDNKKKSVDTFVRDFAKFYKNN